MKNKLMPIILTLVVILATAMPVFAEIDANPHIDGAGISLSSSMSARYVCSTRADYYISVYSVILEVKNANGTWSFAGSLSGPTSATTSNYTKSVDYSSSCTKGKTYRISATFDAGGETVFRISNEMTYR